MSKNKIDFSVAYGEFPSFEGICPTDDNFFSVYQAALSWCASAFSSDELKAFTIEYLSKGDEIVTGLELVPSYCFNSIGKIAYIRMGGNPVSDETMDFYNKHLFNIRKMANNLHLNKSNNASATKQKPHKYYVHYVGSLLEDLIDENVMLSSTTCYETLLKHKSRNGFLTDLRERFTNAYDEYSKARSDYSEYFEDVSDDDIAYRMRCYNRILEDIESVIQNKRATRKSVVKRASIERKVKNVNYCQSDNELKIQSADPSTIIGASIVLLYNKKNRRLTVLVAADDTGLQVKGTTICGFDDNKSICKTVRNPEKHLPEFRRADRHRRIEVLMGSIKGKNYDVSGRIGSNTLILKSIK